MLTNEPWSDANRVWLAQGTYSPPFWRTNKNTITHCVGSSVYFAWPPRCDQ